MSELRAALVMVPPLLANLIAETLVVRLAQWGVNLQIFAAAPMFTTADVAILGPGEQTRATVARLLPPDIPVLALSADLTRLLGPKASDNAPFTLEVLAERLRALAKTI